MMSVDAAQIVNVERDAGIVRERQEELSAIKQTLYRVSGNSPIIAAVKSTFQTK